MRGTIRIATLGRASTKAVEGVTSDICDCANLRDPTARANIGIDQVIVHIPMSFRIQRSGRTGLVGNDRGGVSCYLDDMGGWGLAHM